MSRFSEKAIEEMNREKEKEFEIDYECVQFGIWISNNIKHIEQRIKELYSLYKNEQLNKKEV